MSVNPVRYDIAVHEASHAVACVIQGIEFDLVWIDDAGKNGQVQHVDYTPEKSNFEEQRAWAIMYFSGMVGNYQFNEDLEMELMAKSVSEDVDSILRIVSAAVDKPGDEDDLYNKWADEAGQFVEQHHLTIKRVAKALEKKGTLTLTEVQALVAG